MASIGCFTGIEKESWVNLELEMIQVSYKLHMFQKKLTGLKGTTK